MRRKGILCLLVLLGLLAACSRKEQVQVTESAVLETCTDLGHDMEIRWYPQVPDCMNGGYRIAVCRRCEWVDENACTSVEPLGHTPVERELYHGNCREDSIIAYSCSVCNEEIGYDRHLEEEEHSWIWKEITVWEEEAMNFVKKSIQCCERCNTRPQEER